MSDSTTQPTFDVILPVPEPSKGEQEYQTFRRMLPELLKSHLGKYVAIHNGRVVDEDSNDVALILRVQSKIGYVPIHVGLVTDQQNVVRIPHYHEYPAGRKT